MANGFGDGQQVHSISRWPMRSGSSMVDLPVTVDFLEGAYSDDPAASSNIPRPVEIGAVGCNLRGSGRGWRVGCIRLPWSQARADRRCGPPGGLARFLQQLPGTDLFFEWPAAGNASMSTLESNTCS